jgi:predicted  nucleic acid-binding Zn-ribbon protein
MRELIYNALFKTKEVELSKMEVELANIKELDVFVKNLEKALSQIKSNRTKLGQSLRDVEKVIDELKVNYNTAIENKKAVEVGINSAEKLADQIVKQAKELGIDPRQIDNVQNLVSLVEEIEGTQETIDSFINTSKRYIK